MSNPSNTLAIVMAGGVGSRLAPLTRDRAKPAVPFGGQYRIIDFTLSNCLHSGLRQVLVLTQYQLHSMQTHLQNAWSHSRTDLGEYITAVPPRMLNSDCWYTGTADALYQNIDLIQRSGAKNIIVLSGDHIYRMDYNAILKQHEQSDADLTIACMEVSCQDAQSLGVMGVESSLRIREFVEKPPTPATIPGKSDRSLASMGIYVFTTEVLLNELSVDANDGTSTHDFGNDVMPRLIHSHRVFGYRFGCEVDERHFRYWRDVGTIDAYYEASMNLTSHDPSMDLHYDRWPIRKYECPAPPTRVCRDSFGLPGEVADSILSNGVIVCGGVVERSILSPGVRVHSQAVVEDAVLFDGVQVGQGSTVCRCIIDENVMVPDGETVGVDADKDAARFTISPAGIVVVPKGYTFDQSALQSNVPKPLGIHRSTARHNRLQGTLHPSNDV